MLHLIDVALEAWLRATVPLGATDVDVSFEAPDKEWSAKLTRPTVNVFLWDIRRSSKQERAGLEEVERDGQLTRRAPLPRVELHYVVTAWTTDHGDERAILGGLLRTVLAHPEIPATYLPEPIQELPPMRVLLARAGDDQPEFGATLDGQLRPGLAMTVISAIDVGVFTPAGPPVEAVQIGVTRIDSGRRDAFPVRWVAGEIGSPDAVGVHVVSPAARRVNAAGRFVIAAAAGDELVVETAPPHTVVVPVEGGVRI